MHSGLQVRNLDGLRLDIPLFLEFKRMPVASRARVRHQEKVRNANFSRSGPQILCGTREGRTDKVRGQANTRPEITKWDVTTTALFDSDK